MFNSLNYKKAAKKRKRLVGEVVSVHKWYNGRKRPGFERAKV